MNIIRSLKDHFEVRALEWGMSGWAVSWGLMVLLVPSMFTNPQTKYMYSGMSDIVEWTGFTPSVVIGLIFLITGLARGTALFINGLWRSTPIIRMASSAVSAFFITTLIVGVTQGPPHTSAITYLWLFFADCLSAKRAAEDCLKARSLENLYKDIQ